MEKLRISCDEKRKAAQQLKLTIQLEEMNQKILAKEGKRYQDRIKYYRQNRTFKNNEKNSTSK